MSRVDSVRIAIEKAHGLAAGAAAGAALASDAFFPFADGPQLAIDAGVTAIIQPGGSVRDDEVVAAAEAAGIAMVATDRAPLPPLTAARWTTCRSDIAIYHERTLIAHDRRTMMFSEETYSTRQGRCGRGPGSRGGRHRHWLRARRLPVRGFGPGGPRGRGRKARRGDIRTAALLLLAEEPRNGYQIMQEVEERSDGVWRPSPGSVYPALAQLEDEGLIRSEETDGRKLFNADRRRARIRRGAGR